jgi:hypothetical protein
MLSGINPKPKSLFLILESLIDKIFTFTHSGILSKVKATTPFLLKIILNKILSKVLVKVK